MRNNLHAFSKLWGTHLFWPFFWNFCFFLPLSIVYLFLVLKTDLLTSPYNQDSLCQPAGSCISLQAQGEAEEVADMGEALGKPELFAVHWERGRYIFTY